MESWLFAIVITKDGMRVYVEQNTLLKCAEFKNWLLKEKVYQECTKTAL
jgi:hypothetical protein